MEREIKFRAWDGERMHDSDERFHVSSCSNGHSIYTCTAFSYGGGHWDVPGDSDRTDGVVLMQYTGLKDIDGKDIYESDVVHVAGLKGVWAVEMADGTAKYDYRMGWVLMAIDKSAMNTLSGNSSCRVVGNVHQSPEIQKA